MDKDKLKKIFHSLFNKINNICIAAGSGKKILEEEGLNKLSDEEVKASISHLVKALRRIEENARNMDKNLQEFYESLVKEEAPPAADLPE